ncbi:DUF3108 domain-containing protein [Marivirga sp. S37H4]|uniref:DUF3108 domain-containing protein n=1 Tax=Marivirga aurantiaca TaxID=2802615 RepID=A0A935C5F0_9BACT|nr:DUF3108 domain-containing protein [Marivirga aurantiaca]MBK6263770.1 DUF3108 domain-containing protein [Marivirga aurantiaca]
MKYIILSFLFLLIPYQGKSQCLPQKTAYQSGEVIWYDVKYNWGFIWVDAAEVKFAVEDAKWEGKDAYWFQGYGRSMPKWDWVYKVRDSFDAIGTIQQLKPLYFHRNTNEGGYKVSEKYWFNKETKTIRSSIITSKQEEKVEKTIPYNDCIFDVLTAIYYARNLDFSPYTINEKIPFNLIVDGKVHNLFVRYLGKEIMEMPSGERYKSIKFSALLVEGTIFDGGEDMTVWVTDDQNKIPLKVEAKIQVGWVKAFLKSTKGLKYPELKPLDE